MSLSKGDRVLLISSTESDRVDWSNQEKLTGIVVNLSGNIATLILDHPLNKSPTSEEIAMASKYVASVNGNGAAHILRIRWEDTLLTRLSDSKISQLATFQQGLFMSRCHICCMFAVRTDLLQTCGPFRHLCCVNHIMPVKPNSNTPDLDIVQDLHRKFEDAVRTYDPFEDLTTRVLLAYDTYASCVSKSQQNKVIEDYTLHDLWTCYVCRETHRTHPSTTPFKSLHNQIFRVERSASGSSPKESVSPTSKSIKRKIALIAHHLENMGYKSADVQAMINENSPNEIALWDIDFAAALMASRSTTTTSTIQSTSSNDSQFAERQHEEGNLPSPVAQVRRLATIGREIRLHYFVPEINKSMYLTFPPERTMHYQLLLFAVKTFDLGCVPSDLVMHRLDSKGWSVEVSDSDEPPSSSAVSIAKLNDDDILTFRRVIHGVVGPRVEIQNASLSHHQTTVTATDKSTDSSFNKFAVLAQQYRGLRKIKGDGNCYYRAVYVGLLEQIVNSSDRARKFRRLSDLIAKVIDQKSSSSMQRLVSLINDAGKENEEKNGQEIAKRWRCWEDIEAEILRVETGFDEAFIQICRRLVTKYLLEHAEDQMNGLALQEIILISYDNVSTMSDYCERYVNQMDVDAEGPFVELGLLPLILESNCTIIYLDHILENELKAFESGISSDNSKSSPLKQSNVSNHLGHVHLLLRPGHYDLLYFDDPPKPVFLDLPVSAIREVSDLINNSDSIDQDRPSKDTQKGSSAVSEANGKGKMSLRVDTSDTHSNDVTDDAKDADDTKPKVIHESKERSMDEDRRITTNQIITVEDLNNAHPNIPKFTAMASQLSGASPMTPAIDARSLHSPKSSTSVGTALAPDEKLEMAKTLCDILSIKMDDALELCKRTSLIESAVALYYELEEKRAQSVKRDSERQARVQAELAQYSSKSSQSIAESHPRQSNELQTEINYQNSRPFHTNESKGLSQADHSHSHSHSHPNPSHSSLSHRSNGINQNADNSSDSNMALSERDKIRVLMKSINVDEKQARNLLSRNQWSIIKAADSYQQLLLQDIPEAYGNDRSSLSRGYDNHSNTNDEIEITRNRSQSTSSNYLRPFTSMFNKTQAMSPVSKGRSQLSPRIWSQQTDSTRLSDISEPPSNDSRGRDEKTSDLNLKYSSETNQSNNATSSKSLFPSRLSFSLKKSQSEFTTMDRQRSSNEDSETPSFSMMDSTDDDAIIINFTNPSHKQPATKNISIQSNKQIEGKDKIDMRSIEEEESLKTRNRSRSNPTVSLQWLWTDRDKNVANFDTRDDQKGSIDQGSPQSPGKKSSSTMTKSMISSLVSPLYRKKSKTITREDALRLSDEEIDRMGMNDVKEMIQVLRRKAPHFPTAAEYRDFLRSCIEDETTVR